ncbi:phosphomannomutase [Salipiger aestuarii]|uniref:phosphomannomutase n=1 Tax=Salipiger aestuarii TaxID=568098 RepID=UPI0012384669|nr:phosphomannomutase [Salipiger aestuarii]KAA8610012.1 phosphomannomutase [Salipiger aestuarii]
MAPKFGTSGLRGLVVELTPELVEDHVRAFIAACETGGALCLGRDLRPSSPRIAQDVIRAAATMGVPVVDCGEVPTPALALAAAERGAGAVMITGSHIPADRNGLKFYVTSGEIAKTDEQAITAALGTAPASDAAPQVETDEGCGARFVARYVTACGPQALAGKRIGLYSHSAVGRDMMAEILTGLGAEVIELGRSDIFIPVDTEAVDPETRAQIAAWVAEHKLDALVSTDGDSDRPLLADETGTIVPGDIIGQISAQALGAETVVTPISSNSGVTQKGLAVTLTRIGSPYVIAGMEAAGGKVVGYEANGGFLLGFEADGPAGKLAPLATRDCVLPLVMTLIAAGAGTVSARVAQEPPVVTVADRLQEIPQEASQPFVAALAQDAGARAEFLGKLGGTEAGVDLTDGVRMTLASGEVVHVRPSGNAPELRLYVEAQGKAAAEALLAAGLTELRAALG